MCKYLVFIFVVVVVVETCTVSLREEKALVSFLENESKRVIDFVLDLRVTVTDPVRSAC